jgi:hypothetical protein
MLLKLGAEDHILLFNMHHIISDAWSLGILSREVAALYGAFIEGKPSPLPELPLRYVDFAAWQRRWLEGEALAAELDYWKRQLADMPILELPLDSPRPAVQRSRGKSQIRRLPAALSQGLRLLSQRERATLYMTLLTAFKCLLHFYTRQVDIAVGSSIANRNRADIEDLIGFFVNILVLRTNLGGNPNYRDLLGRVREVTLEAYLHQDLPFEKLVKELNPERDVVTHAPLFRVLFVHENVPMQQLKVPGLTITNFEFDSEVSRYDLNLHIVEIEGEMKLVLQYNSDVIAASTAAKFLNQYEVVLREIVADPRVSLERLTERLAEGEAQYHTQRREERKRRNIEDLKALSRRQG